MLALQAIEFIVFSVTIAWLSGINHGCGQIRISLRKNLGPGYYRAGTEGRLGHEFGSLATELNFARMYRDSDL
jgi:hypothetical protein